MLKLQVDRDTYNLEASWKARVQRIQQDKQTFNGNKGDARAVLHSVMRTGSKLKCHSISFTSLYPSDLVSTAFMTCVVDTRYCLWEARPANKLSRRQREAYTAPPTVGGVIQRGGASIAGNNGGGLPGEPAAHACDMVAGILQNTRTLAGNTQAHTHAHTHTETRTHTSPNTHKLVRASAADEYTCTHCDRRSD